MPLIQRALHRLQPFLQHLGVVTRQSPVLPSVDLFVMGSFYVGRTSFVVADILDDDFAKPRLRLFKRIVGTAFRQTLYATVDWERGEVNLDSEYVDSVAGKWAELLQARLQMMACRPLN